ncbi:MAG: S-methyl-5'-thioadenosine phosphorylase [Peptococcaceae bacterium]|jgi:5'-methylthioadenosine phosphorylase|nr:S-methyl-5'-thioadenosine phosphorylase [Peptococcaceae bacterium]
MEPVEIAVIGGTGVYRADMLEDAAWREVRTRYGAAEVLVGRLEGRSAAFLTRHGKGHSAPPHLINYRANIMALKQLGVRRVVATAAVGSLNERMKPLDFVLADQFLDFTKARKNTFFEGGADGVVHLDVSDPYCHEVRSVIEAQAKALGMPVHQGGCYVCTEGPRFETPAEIRMFRQLGGDLVGMTSVPEVLLAKEAGMCYAVIAMVTNYAAGISENPLSHAEVLEAMDTLSGNISRLIMGTLSVMPAEASCGCGNMGERFAKMMGEK